MMLPQNRDVTRHVAPEQRREQERREQERKRREQERKRREAGSRKMRQLKDKENKLIKKEEELKKKTAETKEEKDQLDKDRRQLEEDRKQFEEQKKQYESREAYREADQRFDALYQNLVKEKIEYSVNDETDMSMSACVPNGVQIKTYTPKGYSEFTLIKDDDGNYNLVISKEGRKETLYDLTPEDLCDSERGVIVRFEKRINERKSYLIDDFLDQALLDGHINDDKMFG